MRGARDMPSRRRTSHAAPESSRVNPPPRLLFDGVVGARVYVMSQFPTDTSQTFCPRAACHRVLHRVQGTQDPLLSRMITWHSTGIIELRRDGGRTLSRWRAGALAVGRNRVKPLRFVHQISYICLKVRGVRDSCVTAFTFGVYVDTTRMFLLGDISYGPRTMPHNSLLLHVTLYNILAIYILFYIFHFVAAFTPRVPSP